MNGTQLRDVTFSAIWNLVVNCPNVIYKSTNKFANKIYDTLLHSESLTFSPYLEIPMSFIVSPLEDWISMILT